MLARGEIGKGIRAGADMFVAVGHIGLGADQADFELAGEPALADARVEDSRLTPRVRADDQKRVGLINAGNGRVEDIGGAAGLEVESITAVDGEAGRAV